MTVWRVINRLRAIAEHGGMTRSPDRRMTTHVVRQHWLARFWMVPFNTGWHLAHHVDMGVPFRNLPRLHAELVDSGWVTADLTYPATRRCGRRWRRAEPGPQRARRPDQVGGAPGRRHPGPALPAASASAGATPDGRCRGPSPRPGRARRRPGRGHHLPARHATTSTAARRAPARPGDGLGDRGLGDPGGQDPVPEALPGWKVTFDAKESRSILAGISLLKARPGHAPGWWSSTCAPTGPSPTTAPQIDQAMACRRRRPGGVGDLHPWRPEVAAADADIGGPGRPSPPGGGRLGRHQPTPGYSYDDHLHLKTPGAVALARARWWPDKAPPSTTTRRALVTPRLAAPELTRRGGTTRTPGVRADPPVVVVISRDRATASWSGPRSGSGAPRSSSGQRRGLAAARVRPGPASPG